MAAAALALKYTLMLNFKLVVSNVSFISHRFVWDTEWIAY